MKTDSLRDDNSPSAGTQGLGKSNTLLGFLATLFVFAFGLALPAHAQTVYTTIANGNWSATSTWQGGNVPPTGSDIPATTTINIRHTVNYNTGHPIKNRGTIRIEPVTGTIARLNVPTGINVENFSTGKWYIINSSFVQFRWTNGLDNSSPTGGKHSGTFKNIGGYVEVLNSYVEIAQDWTSESGGQRLFVNSCLRTGQNYSISGSTSSDLVVGSTLSIGWHGSGNFQLSDATIEFRNVRIQLAGTSGSFQLNSGRAFGIIDYIALWNGLNTTQTGSGEIFASSSLNVTGGLNLTRYWNESISKFVPNGKFAAPAPIRDGTGSPNNTTVRDEYFGAGSACVGTSGSPPSSDVDLSLSKTVNDPDCFEPGDTRVYTLTVTNNDGYNVGTSVQVLEPLDPAITLVNTAGDGSFDSSTGIWTIGNMLAGEIRTRTLTVTLSGTDPITNTASIINLQQNDPNPDNNSDSVTLSSCVVTCRTSWVDWVAAFGEALDGETGPMDNRDGDIYSNLLEYAFCLDPESGYTPVPPFCSREAGDGSIEVFLNRPVGLIDVTYTLYVSASLGSPFGQWTEVTEVMIEPVVTLSEDGEFEQVVWPGVDGLSGLENGGFAVMRVDLDDGTTTATDYTVVCGWRKTELAAVCQTCSVAFLRHELFSGVVDSVDGDELNVAGSSNGLDFATVLDSGVSYYIEVISGDNEGHRMDVAGGGLDTINLALATDVYDNRQGSTLAVLPTNLVGDQIALRRHHTLGGVLSVDELGAGDSVADADCVMFWNGVSYDTYWLADIPDEDPRWVSAASSGLESANDTIIPPGTGFLVFRKTDPYVLTTTGGVRENNFVQPLRQGKTLAGAMYPVDQCAHGTEVSRDMSLAQGFTGGGNAANASRFQLWRADGNPAAVGLSTYWHLHVGSKNYWTGSTSQLSNLNESKLFERDRAVIITPLQDLPEYLIPAAWSR